MLHVDKLFVENIIEAYDVLLSFSSNICQHRVLFMIAFHETSYD